MKDTTSYRRNWLLISLQILFSILVTLSCAGIPLGPIAWTLTRGTLDFFEEPPKDISSEFTPIVVDFPEEIPLEQSAEPPDEPEPPEILEEPAKESVEVVEAVAPPEIQVIEAEVIPELSGDGVAEAEADTDTSEPEESSKREKKKKKRKKKKEEPCPPDIPDIFEIEPNHWAIERLVVEQYAGNPWKIEDIAATWTKEEKGEKIGFGVRPTRCSVLKQAGFKAKDIILSVNGIKIATVWQGLKAYFALRKETEFEIVIRRKGEVIIQRYSIVDNDAAREAAKQRRKEAKEKLRQERREERAERKAEKKQEREEKKQEREERREEKKQEREEKKREREDTLLGEP